MHQCLLISVGKAFCVFQHRLTIPLSAIGNKEPRSKHSNQPNDENMAPHTDPDRRPIMRRLRLSHNERPSNSTSAIQHGDYCSCESPLPLSGDVRLVERRQSRPVGDVGTRGEEGANVADGDLIAEAEHGEAGDEAKAVECDDGPADAEAVADYAGDDNGYDGVVVGWGGEKDGFVFAEAHAGLEDDGEEI